MIYRDYIKRILDFCGAVVLSPIVGAVCLVFGPIIYAEDHGPIFYLAKRRGKDGKVFNMYKLRSMKVNAPDIRNEDNSTFNSEDDPRVTHIGKILRRTSIDELPQIFNVFKGDMSFIGPRPITTNRPLEDYDEDMKIRLKVRPGITGHAQAYVRNSVPQKEKFRDDAEYTEHVTFMGDVKILFKTVTSVFEHKNIYTNK
jgi:undecaprenyl phosphate N,N'-diacetylbacillosamine 1-phosphate transferase